MSNRAKNHNRGGKAGPRIISPNQAMADAHATEALAAAQANPLYPTIERMNKQMALMAKDVRGMDALLKDVLVRFHAFLDFMGSKELMTPDSSGWEYGHYIAEHLKVAQFISDLYVETQAGLDMHGRIEKVREFNGAPERRFKIRGDQFGLDLWLRENTEEMPLEELEALGAEFFLVMTSDPEAGNEHSEVEQPDATPEKKEGV